MITAETLHHDTYNVSRGRPSTHYELVRALQSITPGGRLELPPEPDGPGSDPYVDITRLTDETGFTPTFDLAAAVEHYVAWRADNAR